MAFFGALLLAWPLGFRRRSRGDAVLAGAGRGRLEQRPELAQRVGLNLTDALAREVVLVADLAERELLTAQAEAQAQSQQQVDRDTQRAPAATTRAPATTTRAATDGPRTTAPSTARAATSANVVLDVFDYRASDLIGATVIDDRGESVGKVDDIVVSTEDDKLHVVIAIGGFAGFGAKLISMPFDDLQVTSSDDNPQVRIAMTGEQLEQLVATRPEFRYERQVAQAPGTEPRG